MIELSKKLRVKWKPGDIRKIVIDLPQGLGDQIMCFPLMASLKKYYSDIDITVITFNRVSEKLLSYNRNIDLVKTFKMEFSFKGLLRFFLSDYKVLRRLMKHGGYDLYILTHPNPLRDLLYYMLPARRKIYNREDSHKFLELNNILEYLKIPAVADYSIDFDFQSDILKKNKLKKKGYVLLDVYAQHLSDDPRQWPYFNELITKLKKITDMEIVIAGINKDHIPVDGVVDLVNRTSFDELMYLIQNASAVVSMDTLFFHMSYCLNVPVVALFGPVNPDDRIPRSDKLRYKIIYSMHKCSPCIKNKVRIKCGYNFKCMRDISVDEVASSLMMFLK